MLHMGKNSCKCFTWARTAANASHGPEQLQMLQLLTQDKRQSIYLHLATNSQSEQLVTLVENSSKCFMWASAMLCQPAVYCAVQVYAVWCSAVSFSQRKNRFTKIRICLAAGFAYRIYPITGPLRINACLK